MIAVSAAVLLLVRGPDAAVSDPAEGCQGRLSGVWHNLHEVRKPRNVWLFLVADWFYIDGVNTVVRMAAHYGLSLGFDHKILLMALLITQFTGFPATMALSYLGSRFGPRAGTVTGC